MNLLTAYCTCFIFSVLLNKPYALSNFCEPICRHGDTCSSSCLYNFQECTDNAIRMFQLYQCQVCKNNCHACCHGRPDQKAARSYGVEFLDGSMGNDFEKVLTNLIGRHQVEQKTQINRKLLSH